MTARGFTLLEVLITLIILAIGMLGLANLQSKIHVTEIESYQRAHAVLLMQDMTDRLGGNRATAALAIYTDDVVLGTETDEECVEADLAALSPDTVERAARDRCEWSAALQGASEQRDGNASGGMIAARGCIEEVIAPDPAVGVCQAGVYRVTVVWQGLYATAPPGDALTCGEGEYVDNTGAVNEGVRRAIATEISIGLPTCSSPPE